MKQSEKTKISTKDHIFLCAIELFAKEGYDGLKMDTLALYAKVNKATIYYHFTNKETLYSLILEDLAVSFHSILKENLKDKIDEIEQIEAFIDTALSFVQNNRDIAKIMMNELSYEWRNIPVTTKEKFIPIIMLLGMILDTGVKSGKFNQTNPLLVLATVIGSFNYYLLMKKVYTDFESSKKIDIEFVDGKNEIKDMIFKALLKDIK